MPYLVRAIPWPVSKAFMERARLFARAPSIAALLLLMACSAGQKVQPTAPTVSLTATPTSVGSGVTSTLTWSSTNATACTGSGGWTGAVAPSGTQVTAALTASTSYSLTCTGSGGSSTPATVTVAVVP